MNTSPSSPTPPSIDTLLDNLYEFGYNAGDFGGPHTPRKSYVLGKSKSQLLTLFESVIMEVIGEDVPHTDSHVFKCATLKEDTDMYANKCNCGKADKLLLIAQQRTKAAAALERLRNG